MKPVHEWQQPDMFGGPTLTLAELARDERLRAVGLRFGDVYQRDAGTLLRVIDYEDEREVYIMVSGRPLTDAPEHAWWWPLEEVRCWTLVERNGEAVQ